jgi:hypothetical protein
MHDLKEFFFFTVTPAGMFLAAPHMPPSISPKPEPSASTQGYRLSGLRPGSPQEAERYLDQLWGGERCSICARRGDQVEELHEEAGGWICERCLANRAFAEK